MATEKARLRGRFWLVARSADGAIKAVHYAENLVVNSGLTWIAGALSGSIAAPATMKYIGIGTGTTAATGPQTALVAPEIETRATGAQTLVTTDTANDTYQVVGTVTITTAAAVTEAGLFSAATAGSMLSRQVFSAINVIAADTIQFTWKIDLDAA